MNDFDQLTPDQISASLQNASCQSQISTADVPYQQDPQQCQDAGVLIPLIRHNEQWRIIYIRRADHPLDHHSGQVAFAGGKHEDHDKDLLQTALREAQEEIGIHPDHVSVLGQLNCHYSITRFRITPVVGHIPWPYKFIPDHTEVARVFSIPLSWLAHPANHREQQREFKGGSAPVVYFNEFDGELLWGATARMTLSLIEILSLD